MQKLRYSRGRHTAAEIHVKSLAHICTRMRLPPGKQKVTGPLRERERERRVRGHAAKKKSRRSAAIMEETGILNARVVRGETRSM